MSGCNALQLRIINVTVEVEYTIGSRTCQSLTLCEE
jgi:hypothetical protein